MYCTHRNRDYNIKLRHGPRHINNSMSKNTDNRDLEHEAQLGQEKMLGDYDPEYHVQMRWSGFGSTNATVAPSVANGYGNSVISSITSLGNSCSNINQHENEDGNNSDNTQHNKRKAKTKTIHIHGNQNYHAQNIVDNQERSGLNIYVSRRQQSQHTRQSLLITTEPVIKFKHKHPNTKYDAQLTQAKMLRDFSTECHVRLGWPGWPGSTNATVGSFRNSVINNAMSPSDNCDNRKGKQNSNNQNGNSNNNGNEFYHSDNDNFNENQIPLVESDTGVDSDQCTVMHPQ